MCLNIVQMCKRVQMSSKLIQKFFKCVPMCSHVFKCVQMLLNVVKTCSNVLVMAVTSGYGWVLGGNGLFLVVRIVFRL